MARPVARLTAPARELAAEHLAFARALARPFKEQYPDEWEEFESAACLGLVEAARDFDPGRRIRFGTFSALKILGKLRDVRRERIRRTKHEAPELDLRRDRAAGGSIVAEAVDHRPPVADELGRAEDLDAHLRKLPPGHRRALRLIYLDGFSQAEAGRALGLSAPRIASIHLESLVMLGADAEALAGPDRKAGRPRNRSVPETQRRGPTP